MTRNATYKTEISPLGTSLLMLLLIVGLAAVVFAALGLLLFLTIPVIFGVTIGYWKCVLLAIVVRVLCTSYNTKSKTEASK